MTEELFRDDSYLRTCEAKVVDVAADGIVLDRTCFYVMGGGQPGDSGRLLTAAGETIRIADTVNADGRILHVPEAGTDSLAVGDTVTAEIDWDRRYLHMRVHTALHLLCSLVDGGVTGGQIGDGKGRLDFNLAPEAVPEKEALAARLNALVEADHPLDISWITDAELESNPDLVRTMSVKPPTGAGRVRMIRIGDAVDYQPCGGTHLKSTGEIGGLVVGKIENKGKQNRRINIALADA